MKASDYIVDYIKFLGIKYVFSITGGVIVHFLNSIGKNPGINYVCTRHEQAAAMAAEAYARITKNMGVASATSGPGAINLMTGIAAAYYDSIPVLCITGQVNTLELKKERKIRQFGFQESDVIEIAKPITKMAVQVTEPKKLRYYLEKAVYVAKSGRPGPVLLDLPYDIQTAEINPDEMESFNPKELEFEYSHDSDAEIELKIESMLKLIKESKRPVIVFGAGVKIAGAEIDAKELISKLGIPFTLTWGGIDIFSHDSLFFAGGFGVSATRSGNFAVQNSDLMISIGARLDSREIGSRAEIFAREAKKIIVDIDESEIGKYGNLLNYDIKIKYDAGKFLKALNKQIENDAGRCKPEIFEWLSRVREWRAKYPICAPEYYLQKDNVNPYVFMEVLSRECGENDIIVADTGENLVWAMQAFHIKGKQRLFSDFGLSSMGYALPASIGASFASKFSLEKGSVICINGDGGMQMNIQELQTIAHHQLPVKIFIINNNGLGLIKQFLDGVLNSKYDAASPETGWGCPDFIKIAQAYGIKTESIRNHDELRAKIGRVLAMNEPVLCEVAVSESQKVIPKSGYGKPIEDLAPFLSRDEFYENMIIKPVC